MTRKFPTPARAAVTATLAATLTLAALPAHAEEFPSEPLPEEVAAVQTFDVQAYAPLPEPTKNDLVQQAAPAAASYPEEPRPDEPVSPTEPPRVDTPTDPVAPPPPTTPDPVPVTDTQPEIAPVAVLDEQPMVWASDAPRLAVTGADEMPGTVWGILAALTAGGALVGVRMIRRTRKS